MHGMHAILFFLVIITILKSYVQNCWYATIFSRRDVKYWLTNTMTRSLLFNLITIFQSESTTSLYFFGKITYVTLTVFNWIFIDFLIEKLSSKFPFVFTRSVKFNDFSLSSMKKRRREINHQQSTSKFTSQTKILISDGIRDKEGEWMRLNTGQ
jgi:hypothetical protein